MEKYTGKSIFKGIAIGKILFYQKGEQPVKRVKIEDTAEQIKRYEDARAKAAEQLQGLYEKALKEVLKVVKTFSTIWLIPFAPFPLQKLHHYYGIIRHPCMHRYYASRIFSACAFPLTSYRDFPCFV